MKDPKMVNLIFPRTEKLDCNLSNPRLTSHLLREPDRNTFLLFIRENGIPTLYKGKYFDRELCYGSLLRIERVSNPFLPFQIQQHATKTRVSSWFFAILFGRSFL